MLKSILEIIKKNRLFNQKEKLILGVSGGADSVFLLYALFKLGYTNLIITNIDHKLRENSFQDTLFVENIAKKLGLEFRSKSIDIKKLAKAQKLGIEEAGRFARYRFWQDLSLELKVKKLVLAHNADDQAETVFMAFLRGTGLNGLKGIDLKAKLNDLAIIRPMLSFYKKDILSYLKANKIKFRQDETNLENIYFRNKLRLEILPILEKLNPNLKETLLRLANLIKADENYLNIQAHKLSKTVFLKQKKKAIMLDRYAFYNLDLAMQRRVLRLAILKIQGNLNNVSLVFIENFLQNKLTTIKLDKLAKLHVSKEKL